MDSETDRSDRARGATVKRTLLELAEATNRVGALRRAALTGGPYTARRMDQAILDERWWRRELRHVLARPTSVPRKQTTRREAA
jgi:hypothetical protein